MIPNMSILDYTPWILFLAAQIIGGIIAWNKFTNEVTIMKEKLNYNEKEMRQSEARIEKLENTVKDNYESLNNSMSEVKGNIIELKTMLLSINDRLSKN